MKLRNIFKDKTDRFRAAIKDNDVAELESLRTVKSSWLRIYMHGVTFSELAPGMADVFVNKFTEKDWQRWGYRKDSRNEILCDMMCEAAQAGRADLLDVYFAGGLDLNGRSTGQRVIQFILAGRLPDDAKAASVKKILEGGTDKINSLDALVAQAAGQSGTAAFDLLAEAAGFDVRRNNEELLRVAAQGGQRDMCRHLVEKHGASLEVAITTGRTLGHQDTWKFLEDLRAELKPGESAPPTIESLAEEVKILKAAVRELTARAEARDLRDAERAIDKPALALPAVAVSPAKRP